MGKLVIEADRSLTLLAVVDDPFDGATRMLGDAQRFGCEIRQFCLDASAGRGAIIKLSLRVPPGSDARLIRSRLARHLTVTSLDPVGE